MPLRLDDTKKVRFSGGIPPECYDGPWLADQLDRTGSSDVILISFPSVDDVPQDFLGLIHWFTELQANPKSLMGIGQRSVVNAHYIYFAKPTPSSRGYEQGISFCAQDYMLFLTHEEATLCRDVLSRSVTFTLLDNSHCMAPSDHCLGTTRRIWPDRSIWQEFSNNGLQRTAVIQTRRLVAFSVSPLWLAAHRTERELRFSPVRLPRKVKGRKVRNWFQFPS
jgi:hypothetical protein